MHKKLSVGLLVIVLTLSSGCWDRKEINQSVVVLAYAMDTAKNDQIMFTLQLPVTEQASGIKTESPSFISISGIGSTTVSAARKISLKSPRTLLWQHMEAVVFGEALCRKGLSGIIDVQARNRNVRKTEQVFVARNSTGADILSVSTPIEKLPATALASMVTVQDQTLGIYTPAPLEDFLIRSADPGIESAAPGIAVVKPTGQQPYLELSGTAVFKEGKLVGWLNSDESRGYRWLRSKILTGGIKTIGCPICGQPVVLQTIRSQCQITPKVHNGEVIVDLKVKEEGSFYEQRCLHKLVTKEMLPVLDRQAEQLIRKQIIMAVNRAQILDSDIFGFGAALRKQQPGEWKKYGSRWAEVFPTVKLKIDVDSKIRRTGLRFQTTTVRY